MSWYATSRSGRSQAKVRELVRRRVMRRAGHVGSRRYDHRGLFVTVDGLDPVATAGYAALVVAAARAHSLVVVDTAEPSAIADRRDASPTCCSARPLEPESAALLSAADRVEHVAAVIRPALERGEIVVCDRYVLTSLAVHGGGRGADVDRIRSLNAWSTGGLLPDLTLVVEGDADAAGAGAAGSVDLDAALHVLHDEVDADPDRHLVCAAGTPEQLPPAVSERLERLVRARASLIAAERAAVGEPAPR